MKKFTKFFALILAAGGLVSLAGCAKKTTNYSTSTSANWNVRTSTAVENDSVEYWKTHKEVCTYGVDFEEGGNSYYSISYNTDTAQYSTEFYAEEYDWASPGIPDDLRKIEKEAVYVYKTSLKISGEYRLNKKEGNKAFTDEVTSVCKFRLAGNNLQPVYSLQKIVNTAPNNLSASTIDEACLEVDAVYETFYDYECTTANVQACDNKAEGDKNTSSVITVKDKKDISVFDNSQIRAAVRAMALTASTNKSFNVAVPQNGALQPCVAVCSGAIELKPDGDDMQKAIKKALDEAPADYIFFDSTPESAEDLPYMYRYNDVKLSISEKLTGATTSQWYATVENPDANYSRGVLLKISSPLSFGMGTLNFYLTKLEVKNV